MPVVSTGSAPADGAVAITKSDSTVIDPPLRGIYVGVSGDVVVDMTGTGTDITFKAVPQGTILPVKAKRVKAATTATNLVGLF